MNTLKHLILALALTAGLPATALLADSATPAASTSETAEKKPRVSRVEKLNAELTLTEEQKTQIAALYKEENAALKVVSDDQSLDRSAKIAKNKEIRGTQAAKVRALLTADQQVKFDALTAKHADKDKDVSDKH